MVIGMSFLSQLFLQHWTTSGFLMIWLMSTAFFALSMTLFISALLWAFTLCMTCLMSLAAHILLIASNTDCMSHEPSLTSVRILLTIASLFVATKASSLVL